MSKLIPRDYQIVARDSVKLNTSNLLVLPIRSGKTYIAKLIIDKYFKDQKVLIIVGRINIITQFPDVFEESKYSWILSGKDYDHTKGIFLASFQTLQRRELDYSEFDCLIIDEYQERRKTSIVKELKKAIKTHILLTGTPLTNSNKLFDKRDYNWIQPITTLQMVQQGYLAETKFLSTSDAIERNKSVLKTKSTGEYTEESIRRIITKSAMVNRLLGYILTNKSNENNKTLVYVNFIETANELYEKVKHLPNTFVLHSKLTKKVQEDTLKAFKESSKGLIISVRSLSVGVNIPDADLLLYAIFTKIHSLALQILLRASTKYGDKVSTVIDFSGQLSEDKAVNPMTNFSEYYDKPSCREKCLKLYDQFDIEFIPCLDNCKPEESIPCNTEMSSTNPYKIDWQRIEGKGCEMLSFVWENEYWSEPVPNSSNIYKFARCGHCGSVTRYTLVTLDNSPYDFILTNKDSLKDTAHFIYDKAVRKAYILADRDSDKFYRSTIVTNPSEALKWLNKQFKGGSFHLFSNIKMKHIPNATLLKSLDSWVPFIDYKNSDNTIGEIFKTQIAMQISKLGYNERMIRFMGVPRDKEKQVGAYLDNTEVNKYRFNKELRLDILGHDLTFKVVKKGYVKR